MKTISVLKSGGPAMQTKTIIKLGAEDVSRFVNAAANCDFDIDISSTNTGFTVDAKSVLGVLGLNLRDRLVVTCYGRSEEFDSLLQNYAVA